MDDYVSKPVRVEELVAALQRALNNMESGSAQASSTASNDAVIDLKTLDNLRELRMEGEPDPLSELIDLFLADTPGRIAQMRTALESADAHALESAAHSLKGSGANIGARKMASLCASVMQHARKNEFEPAAKLVAEVEEGFPKVKAILLNETKR
jgi:HPt (histidine-containing phosphotransfer) domain-containing protein